MSCFDGKSILISSSNPLPYLLLILYTGPIHIILPSTIIASLVLKASASSIEWVVSITELFFDWLETLEITLHINLLASGSIPDEGSSRNNIGGLPSRAIATESFLLLPPEYVPAWTCSNLIKFSYFNLSVISFSLI